MPKPPPEMLSAEALAHEGYMEKALEEPPRPDDEKIAEEMLLLRLLAGFHDDEKGRPIVSYLRRNSPEERAARGVLARQLRDGTLGAIARELLALAIDPKTPGIATTAVAVNTVVVRSPNDTCSKSVCISLSSNARVERCAAVL